MNKRLLPIGLFILAAGVAYFYIYPTYNNTIVPAQQQVASYNTALAAATEFTQNEQNLLTKSQAISASDLGKLDWYMPDSVDKIHFIDSLNHLAGSYGVALSGFNITDSSGTTAAPAAPVATSTTSATPATGGTNSFDIAISATGTYDAFQSFLTAVEESAPLLDVMQLSLKSANTGVYTYSMTIRTYWLK